MKSDQAGFTLVEVLAALAVFSLAALALMRLTGESVGTAARLEPRFAAGLVADAILAETLTDPKPLALGRDSGERVQLGRTYLWERTVREAPLDGLVDIAVDVRAQDGAQRLARRSVLKGRHE